MATLWDHQVPIVQVPIVAFLGCNLGILKGVRLLDHQFFNLSIDSYLITLTGTCMPWMPYKGVGQMLNATTI